jgi:hypothetical protein
MKTAQRVDKRKSRGGYIASAKKREREQFRDIVAALAMTGTATHEEYGPIVRRAFVVADAWLAERDRLDAARTANKG